VDPSLIIIGLAMIVAPAILGFQIGSHKDRDSGLALGLFLSWLGVLILRLLPPGGKRCPECAEQVKRSACVCKHCGYRFA
jgi:hypothetical protein